jgi:NAD-dependent dihydropyrimidine dehydrogenase PreA subunit
MPYVIAASCIDVMDRSCMEECPVDCIYEGERKLYINPAECIDCGACEPACPVTAISQDRRIPADQRDFVADNARFFSEPLPGRADPVGMAGGAGVLGPLGVDTELVTAYEVA